MMLAVAVVGFSLLASMPAENSSPPPKARAASPKSASFEQLSQAADQARNAQQDDQAMALYRRALALRPDWEEGLWHLGALLYDKEQYPAARDLLRRFVALRPDAGPGWAILGMSEFQTREYARALDHLRRAMSLGVGDRKEMAQSVFYFVAALLTRFEQYDESTNLLIAMVKSGQKTDVLVEPLGLAALRMPLLPSEIPVDRREMIQTAGHAILSIEAQRRDEAEQLLHGMVAANPGEPGVHFLYGVFLLNVRPEDGMAEINKELEISPTHVPAKLRLAEQYLKDQKMDQALALAQEAAKLEPTNGGAHMVLGEALVAKGDAAGGIRELEMAREQLPQTVRVRWDLLRAYTAAGRSDDAKREKEEIEKLSLPESGRQTD